jgi:peptide/nickel transport system permease protein
MSKEAKGPAPAGASDSRKAESMRKDQRVSPARRAARPARAVANFFTRFHRTRYGSAGLAILATLLLIAITAPIIAPFDPLRQVGESLMPPSWAHLMGTDNIGRDLFSLVLHGTRASLAIGFCAALAALLVGGTIGILAGYWRGIPEAVLMRLAELFQTLPVIIVVLFAIALFGSSFWLLIAAVALAIWPLEARLIYGQFINLREREFVAAAIVADLSTAHIVLREILPNALPPVIVQVALDSSLAILIESGLGFLGLSDANMISWGQLLFAAQDFLNAAWWMSVFPGLAICVAIIGLNLLADGLNEVVNPRASRALIGLAA